MPYNCNNQLLACSIGFPPSLSPTLHLCHHWLVWWGACGPVMSRARWSDPAAARQLAAEARCARLENLVHSGDTPLQKALRARLFKEITWPIGVPDNSRRLFSQALAQVLGPLYNLQQGSQVSAQTRPENQASIAGDTSHGLCIGTDEMRATAAVS